MDVKNGNNMESGVRAGIYVHVPYCRRRCLYCDFYSEGVVRADWGKFVDAILDEFKQRSANYEYYTLYIGGGTPSLMPEDEFGRMADGLSKIAGVEKGEWGEFTIEVNPDDITPRKVMAWKESGVNRVSMGVQSLVDEELRYMGRRHDAARAWQAFRWLRQEFCNISLDVIFGVPGQTKESMMRTIDGLLEMDPAHISAYSLMYEEGSALSKLRAIGKVDEMPEADSVALFEMLCEELGKAGYEQYELSNYAKTGMRSKHNSAYWQGLPYIGLGPGAHSYDGDRVRSFNRPVAGSGESLAKVGYRCERMIEVLTDEELREEMILTRLRTREGLDLVEYAGRFGHRQAAELMKKANVMERLGNLVIDGRRVRLSRKGIMISDEIISELF